MLVIMRAAWSPLMMGDVLAKVAIHNQPLDEFLEHFTVVGMVPHVLVVVIVCSCITLYGRSLHLRWMFSEATILVGPADEHEGSCKNGQG